jgi:hypothetical protein
MVTIALRSIGRFRVFAILLLALAFSAPAFETHACSATQSEVGISAEAVLSSSPAQDCAGCPDCGPACAGGCCHAPHPGMAVDNVVNRAISLFVRSSTWTHVVGAPVSRPSGPERPPRH